MRVLAIETSCDETAVAILECNGNEKSATYTILGNALISQIDIHKKYGGVFPMLAKREHAKNLVPLLEAALEEAEILHEDTQSIPDATRAKISEILARETDLSETFLDFVEECEPPEIDVIAVTAGPGLEPALWVGINFAQALSLVWNKPLVAINHMEGHLLSGLAKEPVTTAQISTRSNLVISDVKLPVLALLISGGHTEIVLMKEWLSYEILGRTKDDAVGEAFDKVARMLELPYPGGPEISRLAEDSRRSAQDNPFTLPRPMIESATCDFSFSGLKTAVLYLLKKHPDIPESDKKHLAQEFEDAVTDVLWKKTHNALEHTDAQTLVIGGGVSANTHIRRVFAEKMSREYPEVSLCIPSPKSATDNAVMIALAGYFRALRKEFRDDIEANGNLSLTANS